MAYGLRRNSGQRVNYSLLINNETTGVGIVSLQLFFLEPLFNLVYIVSFTVVRANWISSDQLCFTLSCFYGMLYVCVLIG